MKKWALLLLLAAPAAGQQFPLPCIQYFVAGQPFCENYTTTPGKEPQVADASTVIVPSQFGFLVFNVSNGQSQYRGFATPEVANRSTDACPFPQVIDRHQSVNGWREAAGTFIVAGNYGGSPTCNNIVVFTRVSPTSLQYNFIGNYNISNSNGAAFVGAQNVPSTIGILMPFAYWPFNSTTGPPWAQINIGLGTFAVGSNFAGPIPAAVWEVVNAGATAASAVGRFSTNPTTGVAAAAASFILKKKAGAPTPTFTPSAIPTAVPPTVTPIPGTSTPTRTPQAGCPQYVPLVICVTVTPTP